MLNPLKIEKTHNTLLVILDKEKNKFLFEGRSVTENTIDFFKPITDWITEYKKEPLEETIVDMDIEYYNTATSMLLLDILNLLDKINKSGKPVKIIWHYLDEDIDILEAGEDYDSILNLTFEFVPHDKSYYKQKRS